MLPKLSALFGFHQFFHQCPFFLLQNPIQDLSLHLLITSPQSPHLWQFCISLSSMTLTLLKRTGQVICKTPLTLGSSDVFFPLKWGYSFPARVSQMGCTLFSISCQQVLNKHVMSVCLITSAVNLSHLAKAVSARNPHYNLIISLLWVRKYLKGDTLRLCKYYFSLNFCCLTVHEWIFLQQLSLWHSNRDLYFPHSFCIYSLELFFVNVWSLCCTPERNIVLYVNCN